MEAAPSMRRDVCERRAPPGGDKSRWERAGSGGRREEWGPQEGDACSRKKRPERVAGCAGPRMGGARGETARYPPRGAPKRECSRAAGRPARKR